MGAHLTFGQPTASLAMQLVVLPDKAYWDLRKPYDMYLPDSVSADDVEAELDDIQSRFRESVIHLGAEDDAWEFPGHYQHVRVFYVYVYSLAIYTPDLATAVHRALEGFDEWICELECYSIPGDGADGSMRTPVYLKGQFYTEPADAPEAFASALGLTVVTSVA